MRGTVAMQCGVLILGRLCYRRSCYLHRLSQVTVAAYSYYCTLLPSLWRWPQLLRVVAALVLTVRAHFTIIMIMLLAHLAEVLVVHVLLLPLTRIVAGSTAAHQSVLVN
jgi:hypothetical protein